MNIFFRLMIFVSLFLVHDSFARVSRVTEVPTKNGLVRFEIHGEESDLPFIKRVEEILERSSRPILEYFNYEPTTPIHFGVDNDSTMANGWATVMPRNYIELISRPPVGESTLLSGEDFVEGLVLHELTHVVHMDQTRGFLAVIRTIFGSFAKWGGIVPRWFAEGVATWAETKYTAGGRLQDKLVRYELDAFLLGENNCSRIDCLDEPKTFPYGHIRYWLGALYLEWLENRKEGTIRCLVVENSNNIPFILNDTMIECTGDDVRDSFPLFLKEYRELARKRIASVDSSAFFKENLRPMEVRGEEAAVWESGFEVLNGKMIFIRHQDRTSSLIVRDLETQKEKEYQLQERVSYLMAPTGHTKKKDQIVFSTLRRFPTEQERQAYSMDLKSGQWQDLNLQEGGDYPFLLSEDHMLFFKFKDHAWSIWERKGESEKKIHDFDKLVQIEKLRLVKSDGLEWIVFKSFTPNIEQGYGLWAYPVTSKTKGGIRSLYRADAPFEFWGSCDGQNVISQDKTLHFLKLTALDQVVDQEIDADWADQVVRIRWDEDHGVMLHKDDPLKAYLSKENCQEVIKDLTLEVHRKKVAVAKTPKKQPQLKEEIKKERDYPTAAHFIPRQWMVSYISGVNLAMWSFSTAVNDPMSIHELALTLNYYNGISELVPNVQYNYNWTDASFGIGQFKSFTQSSLRVDADENSTQYAYVNSDFNWGAVKYLPMLTASLQKKVDFLSSREFQSLSFSQNFLRPGKFFDSFFQGTRLGVRASFINNDLYDDYTQVDLNGQQRFRLFKRLDFLIKANYSKQDNKSFKSGAIFGGGASDLTFTTSHEFYGLQSNDAFGKEMFSGRAQFDLNVWRMYKGAGLFPVYFKDIDLIAGGDVLNTDYIFVKKSLFHNKEITSWHAGVRTDMTILYVAPITIDWFVYETAGEGLPQTVGSEFIVTTSFTF